MNIIILSTLIFVLVIMGIIYSLRNDPGDGICFYLPAFLSAATLVAIGIRHPLLEMAMCISIIFITVSVAEMRIKRHFNSDLTYNDIRISSRLKKLEESIKAIDSRLTTNQNKNNDTLTNNTKEPTPTISDKKQKPHSRYDIKKRKIYMSHQNSQTNTLNSRIEKKLKTNVRDLPFSNRTLNILKAFSIDNIATLLCVPKKELMTIRGLGQKSYSEIERMILPIKLQLGNKPIPEELISKDILIHFPTLTSDHESDKTPLPN